MKKITFLFVFLCASMMTFAIDWDSVDWLGDGAGGGAYTEKYKAVVSPKLAGGAGGFINNIQLHGCVAAIHIAMPSAAFGAFSLDESQYDREGAGFFPHLDIFKEKETVFTVVCNDVTYTFTVFFVDGVSTALNNVAAPVKAVKVIEDGQIILIRNGVKYNALGAIIQ